MSERTVTESELLIENQIVNEVPPKEQNIAMVFQNYALYPPMTVDKDIGFGLKLWKVSKREQQDAVKRSAEMLQLSELLDMHPRQLSEDRRQPSLRL